MPCELQQAVLGDVLGGQHGDAGVHVFELGGAVGQELNSGLDAVVAHVVGVLGGGGDQPAIDDQVQDRVGLVEANAVDAGVLAFRSDGIADADGRAFIGTEQSNAALGDEVGGDFLGLRSIAVAVLGFEDFERSAFEGGAEAGLTVLGGDGGGVDVDDANLALSDAGLGQGSQQGLTGQLAGGGVVGGQGLQRGGVGG